MSFFSTSARTGFQVNEAFTEMTRQIIERKDKDILAQLINVVSDGNQFDDLRDINFRDPNFGPTLDTLANYNQSLIGPNFINNELIKVPIKTTICLEGQ